jgi:hypothetical protein
MENVTRVGHRQSVRALMDVRAVVAASAALAFPASARAQTACDADIDADGAVDPAD